MKASELWLEFVVKVFDPQLQFHVPLCGLCGNTGCVYTRAESPAGVLLAVRRYCICPNGRGLLEANGGKQLP